MLFSRTPRAGGRETESVRDAAPSRSLVFTLSALSGHLPFENSATRFFISLARHTVALRGLKAIALHSALSREGMIMAEGHVSLGQRGGTFR